MKKDAYTKNYAYMWWRDGFRKGLPQMNFLTGRYGMAVNTEIGMITKLGAMDHNLTEAQAGRADNNLIEQLDNCSMNFSVTLNNTTHPHTGFEQIDFWGATSRILESGHTSQRIDIMYYKFKGLDIKGRFEVLALPTHIALEFSAFSHTDIPNATLNFSLDLSSEYTGAQWANNNRILTLTKANGQGLTFEVQSNATITLEGSTVRFCGNNLTLQKDAFCGFAVKIIPSMNANPSCADHLVSKNRLEVSALQLSPHNGSVQEVTFDEGRGYVNIDVSDLITFKPKDFESEANRNTYERVLVKLKNTSDKPLLVPLCFVKEKTAFPVTGLCPFLRDAQSGKPVGIPVQLSKNWHKLQGHDPSDEFFYAAPNDPKRYWEGPWLHAYTLICLDPHEEYTFEYTCTYANWGGVYASSHSQLCLAGWGGNYQLWESSAIGSFGEAFCYDAETAHGRAFIDDIRPLNVYRMHDPSTPKYEWTGCNGGGNFLLYYNEKGEQIPLKRIRVWFKKQGPNLTEVIYTALSADDAIEVTLVANLPRTNDCSRALHSFSYRFLKDVSFSRLVFYQFGADHYNDNTWHTMAVGNDNGPITFEINNTQYSGEFKTPLPREDRGEYINSDTMQRISVPGKGMWIGFFNPEIQETNFCKFGPIANRLLTLHSFSANLNGQQYDKPAFNLYGTFDALKCVAAELAPPQPAGNTIKAGSTVCGIVEYINLPVYKHCYYGPSSVIASIPEEYFNNYKLAQYYSKGSNYSVVAQTGEVLKTFPITVKAANEPIAAEITVTGGIGYVPLTFTNLPDPSSYSLEKLENGQWEKIDQSVHGNDYYQAYYDAPFGTYELTFNVEHTGDPSASYQYRLVKTDK